MLQIKRIKSGLGVWGIVSVSAMLLMVFTMGLLKIFSPDIGFHLKSAAYILTSKHFISIDSFSYTASGNSYYDLQWLYQLLIYSLYNTGGERLLVIGNALLITFSICLIFIRFFKSVHSDITQSCIFFSLIGILAVQALNFEIRPHVLSGIFLNLVLFTLECYKRGKEKVVFLLPIITICWANTHSLAILSLVTIGIYIAGSFVENGKIDKKLFRYLGYSTVAFLINPYFINGLLYPFTQFAIVTGSNIKNAYVSEFQNPFSAAEIKTLGAGYFTSPVFLLHIYSVLSIVAFIRALKAKQYTDFLLLLAYLIFLCVAYKNFVFFIIVSLPLIAKYLLHKKINASLQNIKPASTSLFSRLNLSVKNKCLVIPVIVLSGVIIITSFTDGYSLFRHSPHRFGFSWDKDQLPVEAVAFLNKNNLHGKLLNHFDFGGYLMNNYAEKVFIDGRIEVYDDDFFTKYVESLKVKNGLMPLLKEYDPDIVLFPYIKASSWWQYFITHKKSSGYIPVYFDGLAVIYVKAGKYVQLKEISQQTLTIAKAGNKYAEHESMIEKENKPSAGAAIFYGLYSKQYFSIADQNKAIYCFTSGMDTAALNYSFDCIKKSTVHTPNVYKNLSLYFADKGKITEAEICRDKSE